MTPVDPSGEGQWVDAPPADPEEWTDEQWIAWLEATDSPEDRARYAARADRRPRQRGGMLGAAMLGLRDAIYGRPDDEVVVVVDGSGDPPDDDHPEVHLDPEHPELSEVHVHPRQRPEDERDR